MGTRPSKGEYSVAVNSQDADPNQDHDRIHLSDPTQNPEPSQLAAPSPALGQLLRSATRRLRLQRLLTHLLWGCGVALLMALVVVICHRLISPEWPLDSALINR